jgi:hypothetical protein
MLKIEILDGTVESREVYSQKNDQTYVFHTQQAYLHGSNKYPLPFSLGIESEAVAHKPGMYEIDLSSFVVNRGRLEFARNLTLTPASGGNLKAAS